MLSQGGGGETEHKQAPAPPAGVSWQVLGRVAGIPWLTWPLQEEVRSTLARDSQPQSVLMSAALGLLLNCCCPPVFIRLFYCSSLWA